MTVLKKWWAGRPRPHRRRWLVALGLVGVLTVYAGSDRPVDRTPAPPAAPTAQIPTDLTGRSAREARDALADLGFTEVGVHSVDGGLLHGEHWEVVSVRDAGSAQPLDRRVVVRVMPPQPAGLTPAPRGQAAPPVPQTYFETCARARDAGAVPLRSEDPGYRPGLDPDGDGTACD